MKASALVLIAFFVAGLARAEVVKAKGAVNRKHFYESSQIDIEDIIRAEEDPGFLKYVKDRERQKKLEEVAYINCRKQRKAEEAAYERARVQFVIEESKKPIRDDSKAEAQYEREQKALEQRQEKLRKEYVISQQKHEAQLKMERMARLQKAFSPDRMPASE